jgi:hypothetical protein
MDDQLLRDKLELIDQKLEHLKDEDAAQDQRILKLESDKEVKKSHMLEYIVIALIVIETLITALDYIHHG